MSTEPDWSTAPEHATHYGPATPMANELSRNWRACWYRVEGGLVRYHTAIDSSPNTLKNLDCWNKGSARPVSELIPRPTIVTENDVDAWL